ncbi:hypothetical protein JCM9279_006974 [Rhodotorula babjevae]
MASIYDSVLTAPWISTPSDGVPTSDTLRLQHQAEQSISHLLTDHLAASATVPPALHRDSHARYLTKLLTQPLPRHFTGLDASRPWLLYWSIHSLALLDGELDPDAQRRVVDTLRQCQNDDGGFGGGPGQLSHLAPSYAAVCALAYTGAVGWNSIDRQGMYRFLLSLKQPDGSFIMHDGGEVDVRGCYCALTISTLLNLLTPDLARHTPQFIAACQTYEGGLASSAHPFAGPRDGDEDAHAAPLGEAHGGYAFCAAASWAMLRAFSDPSSPAFLAPSSSSSSPSPSSLSAPSPSPARPRPPQELDVRALLRWSASLQAMPIEGGGFRGRTNKLVDGCYSWWGGGLVPVVESLLCEGEEGDGEEEEEAREHELYDRTALQQYIVLVAQAPSGGLRDKPGKPADAYHTCYNLSGAASAQHAPRVVARRARRELREGWVSPFGLRAALVEVEVGGEGQGHGQEGKGEVVRGEGEGNEAAEGRMREVWSRALAWELSPSNKVVYGDPANELVPAHPVFNLTFPHVRGIMAHFYRQPPLV